MATTFIIDLFYLLGAIGFVWGLRLMSSPDSARRGNIIAGIGMALAIIGALGEPQNGAYNNYLWILGGLAAGGGIGYYAAVKVKMTAMPQMVSIFNGLGGACAVILGLVEILLIYNGERPESSSALVIIVLTIAIGGIAFTGSLLAYAKLEGLVKDSAITLKRHDIINMLLLAVTLACGFFVYMQGAQGSALWAMVFILLALVYGLSFVAPIGGADMPVVISLLNSFSGLSAAAAGLIYNSNFMLIGGILVGAAGTILTVMMCRAMNRSLLNVLIGGFGGGATGGGAAASAGGQVVKEISLPDAAILLYYSKSVIFVPGYGLAVAQAQKTCKEIDDLLEANGVEVRYAIHPVAGRMPGHMNVLLAEADVPYPKLLDLDDANSALQNADVAIVVGANDVVNPAAENDPSSPIYGMPVLKVWQAKHVIVIKRSMGAGYAGIENPLFFHERNKMLFGDAKVVLSKLGAELKNQ